MVTITLTSNAIYDLPVFKANMSLLNSFASHCVRGSHPCFFHCCISQFFIQLLMNMYVFLFGTIMNRASIQFLNENAFFGISIYLEERFAYVMGFAYVQL